MNVDHWTLEVRGGNRLCLCKERYVMKDYLGLYEFY